MSFWHLLSKKNVLHLFTWFSSRVNILLPVGLAVIPSVKFRKPHVGCWVWNVEYVPIFFNCLYLLQATMRWESKKKQGILFKNRSYIYATNIENWRSWKMSFFWVGHFDFFFSKKFFFCIISMKTSSPFIWGIIYFCTMTIVIISVLKVEY